MRTLTTEQFKLMRKGSGHAVVVVNTLGHEDFHQTHIPDSINIPLKNENFIEDVEQAIGGRQMPVIVYCASPECDASTRAAERLEEAGFSNVYDYEGGAQAWTEAGNELQNGQA